MLCAFCRKRITKGKKGRQKRIMIEKRGGRPGLFIHARCLIPWQCMQRLQGKQINGYPIHVTADYARIEKTSAVIMDNKTMSLTDFVLSAGRQMGKTAFTTQAQIDLYRQLIGGGN